MHRTSVPDQTIPALLFADGLVCILLAIFAHTFGLDPNPDWGWSRFILSIIGIILIGFSWLLLKRKPSFTKSETLKITLLIGHIWGIILIIYIWFITFGTFTEWRASTRYYSLLADAFGKGQLHVDVDPGAALLAADDPYNSEGRPPFKDEVWDLSLYKEKLYLYWGPVPALILTPVQSVVNTKLADMYLVFFFLSGLLIFNSLIIVKLWGLFFPDIPIRNLTVSIFVAGLILPIPWSLSIPDVYEAAIGAGQFFLMGGIYFIIHAFTKDIQKRHLLAAGFFWACSVGSRALNVLPVLFLVLLVLFWIWKSHPQKWILLFAPLIIPLAVGAFSIGWYNWARFDSPLEFGLRYQITIYNLNRDLPLAFQPDYLPYNIIAYIFLPFEFISGFPFIQPVGFSNLLQSLSIAAPKLYAAGNVTGILFFAPFLLFAGIPIFRSKKLSQNSLQAFIILLLGGSFLISFVSLLLYYYGQMRFMVDVISQVTLLAILGYWGVICSPNASKLKLHLANLLIAATLIISLLLAVTSESGRMEKLNPDLMEQLNSEFHKEQ